MKNFKWGTESFNNEPIYVVLFVSRNKDNKHIKNFKERRQSFITHEPINSKELKKKFEDFVAHGEIQELSRMYYSVNERDGIKIYQALLHFLIDNPDFNLCSIQPKLAGIAAQKECAKTKHWMFDFDIEDSKKVFEFIEDIKAIDDTIICDTYTTPHGWAIITDRGFDTRTLLTKWNKDVTLKRDDLLCVNWKFNE